MLNEEAGSSTSTRRVEALSHSPTHVAHRTSEKNPPPYGAQHRQEALWEGGNEALPPRWQQFEASDGSTQYYQDSTLVISSYNRPLPGLLLDYHGDLVVPGCEWHISPLGRSYFVNHNTRTTSWKKPKPERPAGSLTPECIIDGHSERIRSLTFLKASCNVMSASDDGLIRQWKRDGEPVRQPLYSDGGGLSSIAVSPDETMVVCGSADGRLRLWNRKEGSMIGEPWEGHDAEVRCLDWSPNALEIASGSDDGTIRRWNPDTGRQIAAPIKTSHGWVYAVKYSPQGDKFMSGGVDDIIHVWSKDGKLLIKINGHCGTVMSLCWCKTGAHIFSGSGDYTIRMWQAIDGAELVVLRGHTQAVRSICQTPNERYIVSASDDFSVRIWDLETDQAVGDPLLHDDRVHVVAMSPDGTFIASAELKDKKIYVWNLEAALERYQGADDGNVKLKGRPAQPRVAHQPIPNTGVSARYGNDFFAGHSDSRTAPPANSSLLHWRSLFSSLRFSARPSDAPRPSPRESRHWNFRLRPVGKSRRYVEVAPCRDEDRYGITPETDAEAAAAMQRTDGNEAENSTQPGQPTAGAQASQVLSTSGPEDIMCGVNCCGIFFGIRRPTSHQS